jgi:protein-tyrosine phosphatase
MTAIPDRILTFERCFNFRDLGGYAGLDGRPVRWRRLFRSMTPQYMSEADAVAVRELNITLVIDFRGDRYPHSGPIPGEGGTRLALSPVFVQRTDAEYERYRMAPPHEALPRLLETYGAQFAGALTAMAGHPDAHALYHCRLGKDRTGVFSALVLKLLGVSDDDVVQDYMLTELQEPYARRLLDEAEVEDISSREPLVAKEPPSRAAIEGVLQRLVSRYGGAYGYFAQYGVSAALLGAFVESALEPPPAELRGAVESPGAPEDTVPV